MKRYVFLGHVIALLAINTFAQSNFDYGSALEAAITFFDANRCGPDAGKDNAFSWRGACHTSDQVPGGYHDAGDHVKFGLPQCWSAATMGWAMYEFPTVFEPRKDKFFHMMKWFTDYFLACHPSAGTFIYNIGDGNADHGYWGAPEGQGSGSRPVIKAPPGSDVCGEASAALSLMYLNYKSVDEGYAQKCLDAAKDLYTMAVAGSGSAATARCSDGSGGNFYKSSSHYDDVIWAGIWLYTATGDIKYLDKIDEWIIIPNDPGDNPFQKKWSPAWDDVTMFNLIKMAEITGDEKYYEGVVFNLNWFQKDLAKSPGGLPIVSTWAPLRYASAEAGVGFMAYKLLGYDGFNTMGNFIMDYCIGKNPENRSYLTGWGNNPPKHPHHRANEPTRGGATKGIIGALVGGPTDDSYEDNVNNYTETEVALDYNASFILGMASCMYVKAGGKSKNRGPSVKITSPLNGIAVPEGAAMDVKVVADDADGKVMKIDLYQGDKLLGSSPTSPYLYKFDNPGTGDVSLKAIATDDSGKVSNSIVTITYIAPCKSGEMLIHTGWVATASVCSQNAGEGPSSALDGKPDTRWGSGTAMAQGMWYQIDMGFPRNFDEVIIDATGSGTDFPRRFKMYATNDTGSMGNPVAVDSGASVKIVALDAPITAQYIRLVCEEGQGGSWWSIHEINVPCAGSAIHQSATLRKGRYNVSFQFDAAARGNSVFINYSVPVRGKVTIEEYVLNGSRTNVLFDGFCNAGEYSFKRSINRSGSKMVLLKINYGGSSQLKRVVWAR
jgi:hypothetical protein